ncbi:MAG: recombinase family protein [Xanthobacteraceae bacterium]
MRETKEHEHESGGLTPDLFADFNCIPKGVDKTEFYQHDQNWSNRMILGDSLQVMASLADRLGRSLQDLVSFLSELHALGIDLFLYQQGLDTTTPAGKVMFQMMDVFAEFERSIIQERVRAGLARARREGKRLGRPPIAPHLEKQIRGALSKPARPGVRKIAKRFRVDPGAVQRISKLRGSARVASR